MLLKIKRQKKNMITGILGLFLSKHGRFVTIDWFGQFFLFAETPVFMVFWGILEVRIFWAKFSKKGFWDKQS